MVHLTVEQIDTLQAIKKVYAETGKPMTLSQIANVRKRKVSTCFRIVSTLADKGLVLKKKGKVGAKGVNAGITPSAAGSRILAKMTA
jgi:DNA-binding MarR family transcriptional regulator